MRLTLYDIKCIQSAKDFIDADITRHYTVEEIAEHAIINTTKLKKGFKELFGSGLYQYLKEQRLQEGKWLVENTDKTLEEISRASGYKYVNNFITAFKKEYGKTPALWRRG